MRGEKEVPVPDERREKDKGKLVIKGGGAFNIHNLSAEVPLGRMVAITGVSGSGKSTFLYEILYENLRARFDKRYRTNKVYNAASFTGTEHLSRAILIDQSPIGRTPRSNPATYTGAFTFIRDMFATTTEARARGWKASRFSLTCRRRAVAADVRRARVTAPSLSRCTFCRPCMSRATSVTASGL